MSVLQRILCIAAALLAAPLVAQVPAPPVRESVDANGVDMVSGAFNASMTDVSIGPSGPHGLSLTRSWNGSAGWWNSAVALIGGSSNNPVVTLENGTTTFTWNGSSYVADQGNGAMLTASNGDYTYTGRDGTVAYFKSSVGITYPYSNPLGIIDKVVLPDGTVHTFHYETQNASIYFNEGYVTITYLRLLSITSNFGYQLRMSYPTSAQPSDDSWAVPIRVTAINTAVEACSPTAASCSVSSSWPHVDYSGGIIKPTDVTDPTGRTWHYTYNGTKLSGIRRPGASSEDVTIGYNGSQVTSIGRIGSTWTYGYSPSGSTRTITTTNPATADPATQRSTVSNQSTGLVSDSYDELNHHTAYEYDSVGRLTKVTAQDGNSVEYVYDEGNSGGRGNITSTIAHPKSGTATITATAQFESGCSNPKTCNQPQRTKDARSHQTDYTYDPGSGLITSVNLPADNNNVQPYVKYEYTTVNSPFDGGGSITLLQLIKTCQSGAWGCSGPNLVGSYLGYKDWTGNFLLDSVAKGAHDSSLYNTVSYAYDDVRNVTAVTNPNNDVTHMGYDAARRPEWVTAPDPDGDPNSGARGKATRNIYNVDGTLQYQQVGTSGADGSGFYEYFRTNYGYDSYGRPVWEYLADRNGTRYSLSERSYDALGRLDCTNQRMNQASLGYVATTVPVCDLSPEGADGPDRITRTDYDAASRVKRTWAGYRTATAYYTDYDWTNNDKLHRVYNPSGDLNTAGSATTYEYDGFDRLQLTCYNTTSCGSFGAGVDHEEYSYDENGNLTGKRLRDGNWMAYEYDALNRLTKKTPPVYYWRNRTTSYAYDNLNHMLEAKDVGDGGMGVTMTYDALGRLRHEQQPFGSADYEYDLAGHRTYVGYGDGYWVKYRYDHAGRMTEVREYDQNVLARYDYDEMDRRVGIARGNGANTSYGYGATPWLTGMTHDLNGTANDLTTGYINNPAGQIVRKNSQTDAFSWAQNYNASRAYEVNGLNQYTKSGTVSLGYDARGNLNNAPTPGTGGNGATSGQVTYTYTADNLVVEAGGNAFNYDLLGRMNMDQTDNRLFSYAGSQLLVAHEYNGTLAERYVYGADEAPLVRYDGNGFGTRRYLYTDERGSVIAVADDGGNATAINRYDEYGIPATSNDGRFGYTGQAWNRTLKMWNYKARIYSPTLGRFLQTDPIGYSDGLNWYNYVGSDPVNDTDPTGTVVNLGTFPVIASAIPGGQDIAAAATVITSIPVIGKLLGGLFGGHGGAAKARAKAEADAKAKAQAEKGAASAACLRALTGASNLSIVGGLPLPVDGSKALLALGTGVPSALRLTSSAMRLADQVVGANPGLLSDIRDVGGGVTRASFPFGAGAAPYSLGAPLNGPSPGGLGGLLGQADVLIKGGHVVGIEDVFDYDPSNHSGLIGAVMSFADGRISSSCAGRVAGVPISGGIGK